MRRAKRLAEKTPPNFKARREKLVEDVAREHGQEVANFVNAYLTKYPLGIGSLEKRLTKQRIGTARLLNAISMIRKGWSNEKINFSKFPPEIKEIISHNSYKSASLDLLADKLQKLDSAEFMKIKKIAENEAHTPEEARQEAKKQLMRIMDLVGFTGAMKSKSIKEFQNVHFLKSYEYAALIGRDPQSTAAYSPHLNTIMFMPWEGTSSFKKSMAEETAHFLHFVHRPTLGLSPFKRKATEFLAELVNPSHPFIDNHIGDSLKKTKSKRNARNKLEHIRESLSDRMGLLDVLIAYNKKEIEEDSELSLQEKNYLQTRWDMIRASAVERSNSYMKAIEKGLTSKRKIGSLRNLAASSPPWPYPDVVGDKPSNGGDSFSNKDSLQKFKAHQAEFDYVVKNIDNILLPSDLLFFETNWKGLRREMRYLKSELGHDIASPIIKAGLRDELIEKYGPKLFTMSPMRLLLIARKYKKKANKILMAKGQQ